MPLLKDTRLQHSRTDFQSEYKGPQQWVITTFSTIQTKSYTVVKLQILLHIVCYQEYSKDGNLLSLVV